MNDLIDQKIGVLKFQNLLNAQSIDALALPEKSNMTMLKNLEQLAEQTLQTLTGFEDEIRSIVVLSNVSKLVVVNQLSIYFKRLSSFEENLTFLINSLANLEVEKTEKVKPEFNMLDSIDDLKTKYKKIYDNKTTKRDKQLSTSQQCKYFKDKNKIYNEYLEVTRSQLKDLSSSNNKGYSSIVKENAKMIQHFALLKNIKVEEEKVSDDTDTINKSPMFNAYSMPRNYKKVMSKVETEERSKINKKLLNDKMLDNTNAKKSALLSMSVKNIKLTGILSQKEVNSQKCPQVSKVPEKISKEEMLSHKNKASILSGKKRKFSTIEESYFNSDILDRTSKPIVLEPMKQKNQGQTSVVIGHFKPSPQNLIATEIINPSKLSHNALAIRKSDRSLNSKTYLNYPNDGVTKLNEETIKTEVINKQTSQINHKIKVNYASESRNLKSDLVKEKYSIHISKVSLSSQHPSNNLKPSHGDSNSFKEMTSSDNRKNSNISQKNATHSTIKSQAYNTKKSKFAPSPLKEKIAINLSNENLNKEEAKKLNTPSNASLRISNNSVKANSTKSQPHQGKGSIKVAVKSRFVNVIEKRNELLKKEDIKLENLASPPKLRKVKIEKQKPLIFNKDINLNINQGKPRNHEYDGSEVKERITKNFGSPLKNFSDLESQTSMQRNRKQSSKFKKKYSGKVNDSFDFNNSIEDEDDRAKKTNMTDLKLIKIIEEVSNQNQNKKVSDKQVNKFSTNKKVQDLFKKYIDMNVVDFLQKDKASPKIKFVKLRSEDEIPDDSPNKYKNYNLPQTGEIVRKKKNLTRKNIQIVQMESNDTLENIKEKLDEFRVSNVQASSNNSSFESEEYKDKVRSIKKSISSKQPVNRRFFRSQSIVLKEHIAKNEYLQSTLMNIRNAHIEHAMRMQQSSERSKYTTSKITKRIFENLVKVKFKLLKDDDVKLNKAKLNCVPKIQTGNNFSDYSSSCDEHYLRK